MPRSLGGLRLLVLASIMIVPAAPAGAQDATPSALPSPMAGPLAQIRTSGDVATQLVLPLEPGTATPDDEGTYELRYIDASRHTLVVTLEMAGDELTGAFVAVGLPGTSIMEPDYFADFLRSRCRVMLRPIEGPGVAGDIACAGLEDGAGSRTIDLEASFDSRAPMTVDASPAPSVSGSPMPSVDASSVGGA